MHMIPHGVYMSLGKIKDLKGRVLSVLLLFFLLWNCGILCIYCIYIVLKYRKLLYLLIMLIIMYVWSFFIYQEVRS